MRLSRFARYRWHFGLLGAALVTSLPLSILAGEGRNETQENARLYEACLERVEQNAEAALEFARKWNIEAHGLAGARHCEALALLALNRAQEAAELLEEEAEKVLRGDGLDDKSPEEQRGLSLQLFIQAALAWRQDGNEDRAYSAISSALARAGGGGTPAAGVDNNLVYELYLERGRIQINRREFEAALEDFTLAIDQNPERGEGFLERARLFRQKKNYPAARLDLKAAAGIAPDDPEILLESGIVYRLLGDKDSARAEWQKIIDTHPDSAFADLARENIGLLNR